jgi:hypothetical protein
MLIAVYFGDAYVVRDCSLHENVLSKVKNTIVKTSKFANAKEAPAIVTELGEIWPVLHPSVQAVISVPDEVVLITPRNKLASCKQQSICNITCLIDFDSNNFDSLHAGVHGKVCNYIAQPWVGHSMNTIFGTAFYREKEHQVHCSGMRRVEHAVALCGMLRRGPMEHIAMLQATMDTAIGKFVQVTDDSFLLRVARHCFKEVLQIMPRTEENANMLYLQVPNLLQFIKCAEQLKMISSDDVLCTVLAADIELQHIKLCLQITKIGHVTHRYIWKKVCFQALQTGERSASQSNESNISSSSTIPILRGWTTNLEMLGKLTTAILYCMC